VLCKSNLKIVEILNNGLVNVVSFIPFEFNLIIPQDVIPEYVVKFPQHNILPSDCINESYTSLLNPVPIENVLSLKPSEFNLIISFLLKPEYSEKFPVHIILSSDCNITLLTVPVKPVPIVKHLFVF
jgi:hypothetical protein